MIFSFPFEQSPPRINPPYSFNALFIPLYTSSTQIHSVLAGRTRLIVIPIVFLLPLDNKSEILLITAFGIQGELILRRNACKPGDRILTTGIHGLSKLGFLIQNNFDKKFSLNERLIAKSVEHFCRPRVYPNFLNNLLKTRSNKNIKRIGCTDSSDGLFQDLQDLAIASNCKAIINYEKIQKDKDWPKGCLLYTSPSPRD